MPKFYGEYDDEAETQFVGCINCEGLVDLREAHPMYREEDVSEVGDVMATTYHFCSDDCLDTWAVEKGYRS